MIYCVEDDENIQELIVYALKTAGFEACGFSNAADFFEKLNTTVPKMILLDIMLPEKDGLSILADLKKSSKTKDIPIILITAKSSELDKVKGLDFGADDYMTKPFSMMEMLSRVKAVLRRCENKENSNEINVSTIGLNKKKRLVTVNGHEVALSFREFELLTLFMENTGTVFTRDTLLTSVWGYNYDGESRTVDVHIRTLRQKLGEGATLIQTVRNVGYKMDE